MNSQSNFWRITLTRQQILAMTKTRCYRLLLYKHSHARFTSCLPSIRTDKFITWHVYLPRSQNVTIWRNNKGLWQIVIQMYRYRGSAIGTANYPRPTEYCCSVIQYIIECTKCYKQKLAWNKSEISEWRRQWCVFSIHQWRPCFCYCWMRIPF